MNTKDFNERKLKMVGNRYGKLTVVGLDPNNRYGVACKCDCGNVIFRPYAQLKAGNIRSCGCLKRTKEYREMVRKTLEPYYKRNYQFGTAFNRIGMTHPSKNNTTGKTGVCPNYKRGGYDAYLYLRKQRLYFDHFDTLEDAIRGREEAEERFVAPMLALKEVFANGQR